ncbi:rab11 family-interacting protein 1-like isoform X2 [Carcharodon carcharias]|uniref:rab11 family-interacting protein 1-like isoform X2 n=1 Tax=Carcharodon carcharias TaxID=13397 RepID=UPI001B7E98CC|nr:rab11 family-interacting protein 1-like isoform X2 [Carcharodon carcharias]
MSLLAQSQKWYPTHVKVVVIQARGLRSKGKNGTNDAYAIMQLGKEKYSSSVAEKSGAPLWREEAEFELPVLHSGNAEKSTLYLIVMHRALVGLDKFLGQVTINLSELYESKTRNKAGWYKLQSKAGKKEKERGEIEADFQFVRNNMTASMFDLSMKDKSRSTLGRLKDKLKGKKKDGFSDSASAIVPSISSPGNSDDEAATPDKKKKSKLKLLFPKSNLHRTSLSQSMSVIPTAPSSPPGSSKRAKNSGSEDFTEIQLHDSEEESSNKTLSVPKMMSHKRAASADTKQLSFASAGNMRKDSLSLFGGLKPKGDPVSQSNLCINGSHVYTKEPSQAAPVKPRADSKPLYGTQFYTSAEDLTGRFSADPPETSSPRSPSRSSLGTGSGEQGPKVAAVPDTRVSGGTSDLTNPQKSDGPKEGKESKPGGLSASSAGKKGMEQKTETSGASGADSKSLNPFENDQDAEEATAQPGPKPSVSKTEAVTKKEETKRGGLMSFFPRKAEPAKAPEAKESGNPFEENTKEVKKPTGTSVWSSRTAAVKPKLEVSPKAETKAETLSPLVPPSPPLVSALTEPFSSAPPLVVVGTEGARNSNYANLQVACSPPAMFLDAQSTHASVNAMHKSSASPPSPVKELDPSHLPPLPSSSSSSCSSRSSNTEASGSSTTELAGDKAQGVRTPRRESSRTSAQALLQELTGKSSTTNVNQQPPPNGERASAGEIKDYEGLSGDWRLEANPECKSESSEARELAAGELQTLPGKPELADSPGDVTVEPKPLLHLLPSLPSETRVPSDPPKVPPRNRAPTSEGKLNLGPLAAEVWKVPPIPAPRNVARVIANDDSPRSPQEIPSDDLMSFERDANYSLEPLTVPSEIGGTDFALGVGDPANDSSASSPKENDPSATSVGFEEQTSAISARDASEGEADDYPVTEGESHSVVHPGGLPLIPEKVEDSTGGGHTAPTTETARWLESPLSLSEPAAGVLSQEMQDHTPPPPSPPPPDPKPDLVKNLTADSEHLGASQLKTTEEIAGSDSGLREPSVSRPETDDAMITLEKRRKSFDQIPTLVDKSGRSQISTKAQKGPDDLVIKLDSSGLCHSVSHSLQNNSILDLSEESSDEHKPEMSKSSVAVPPLSTIVFPLPSASPAGPCVSLLPRSLSPPPFSQSTPPVTDAICLVKPSAGNSPEVEHSGQKRLLQARVSPTETQPIQSQSSGSAVSSRRRPHPVKPMSAAKTRTHEASSKDILKTSIKAADAPVPKSSTGHLLGLSESQTLLKLTHDELIQLVLKQKDVISKKDCHVRELESYIDNLLVRVMEETPNILRVSYQPNRKAERV